MEEILEFVAIEIKRSGYGRHLSAGVVLTGGGALIPGTVELAAEILGLEARVGRPLGLTGGLVEEVDDPKFATGVGLVLHGLRTGAGRGASLVTDVADPVASPNPGAPFGDGYDADPDKLVTKIASRMRSWFDEL
jgi:cell division protein FtsA